MKQKSGYFSNTKKLIMFVICMLFLFAIIVCSIILISDAAAQARSGASEYTPNYQFLYFFATLVIAFVPYLVIYLITVFIYYYKNRNKGYQPSVVVRVKGDSEQIQNIYDRFGSDPIYGDMHAEVPLYIHVNEKHEFTKGEIFNFAMFLIWPQLLITIGILAILYLVIFFVVLPLDLITFYVALGFASLVTLIVAYVYFYFVPSKLYKRIVNNRLPTSLRVFNDRIEEASLLVDGSEFSYVFNYDKTRFMNTKKFIYVKGVIAGKEKTIAGVLIRKENVKQEIVDFIIKKYKNK